MMKFLISFMSFVFAICITHLYLIHYSNIFGNAANIKPKLLRRLPESSDKPMIAICTATRSTLDWQSVFDSSVQTIMIPSIEATVIDTEKENYDFYLYLAADDDDAFWLNNKDKLNVPKWLTLKFLFFQSPSDSIPFNEMMRQAYVDGADYMVRFNDDSEFLTSNWVSTAIETLGSYNPPNVGMVGPHCKEGNTAIMTHDMVHRTHFNIFLDYYPDVFSAWYVDDWISNVYGPLRSTKIMSWVVKHHIGKHGTRYKANTNEKKLLEKELRKGKEQIKKYLANIREWRVFKIHILTMNREKSLRRLLNSLESSDYGSDQVEVLIHIDKSSDNDGCIEVAKSYNFSHGKLTVEVASKKRGLAKSWLQSCQPKTDTERCIILEDDVELSPKWYIWVNKAWDAYENRDDIMGISLNRQTRIMKGNEVKGEIVNNHVPFLYKFVGTWGYSPHPKRWKNFLSWHKQHANETPVYFDVPGILPSSWWREFIKQNRTGTMWTQYMHYYVDRVKPQLYHLYVNLPDKKTISAHHRERGEHYGGGQGKSFETAQMISLIFPAQLEKYGWDGISKMHHNEVKRFKSVGLWQPTIKSIKKTEWKKGTKVKALVTGGAGFIGSHVASECQKLGMDVVVVDDMSGGFKSNIPENVRFIQGDLKDAKFVSDLFEREKFVLVYHLAAYAAEGLSHFIRNYNYNNNLIASTNLITQSIRVGTVKKFIFTSSIAVYGSGRTPMVETMAPQPEDPYGISKFSVEMDLKAAHEMWGLNYVIFRPHNVYGPGQNMYDKYRNVVGIFMNQLQAGKNLTIFGDGSQTRKFSYIDDVSKPIALSGLYDHVNNEIFNVGGDIATTVNELAEVVKTCWGKPDADIVHLDARNEVAHAESGHDKLNNYFPMLSTPTGLREGMIKMVKWAKSTGKYFHPVTFPAVEIKKKMPKSWVTKDLQEVPAFTHDIKDNVLFHSCNKFDAMTKSLSSKNVYNNSLFSYYSECNEEQVTLKEDYTWRGPSTDEAIMSSSASKTLVVITVSASYWAITEKMLISLASIDDDFDVAVIDDHSKRFDIEEACNKLGVFFIKKDGSEPKGLTDSWNTAYDFFKRRKQYDYLILSNNDLLIPSGTINKLTDALSSGWDWLLPIVSKRGSKYPFHTLPEIYKSELDYNKWSDLPLFFAKVQDILNLQKSDLVVKKVVQPNGYFMAFRRDALKRNEFSNSKLFDPQFINIGNEDDLAKHFKGNIGVHTQAFVFHYKGFTLSQNKDRNVLSESKYAEKVE